MRLRCGVMDRRKLLRITLGVLLTVLCVGIFLASRGRVETYADDPPIRIDAAGDGGTLAGAPAWAEPCRTRPPRPDRTLLAGCARVTGRVVWDSRRPADPHVIVLARFGLVVGKLARGHPVPSLGSRVTLVGPLVRARGGLREIDAMTVR